MTRTVRAPSSGRTEHCGPAAGEAAGSAGTGLHGEDLVDSEPVRPEGQGRAGHVEAPDPYPARTRQPDRPVPLVLEVGDPGAQGVRVVLAQRLHVADLEPGRLQRVDDRRQRLELT